MAGCKNCGVEIPKNIGRSVYCSNKCSISFNRNKYARLKKYKEKIVIQRIERYCIGLYCRGEKKFMAYGKHNRICPRCLKLSDGINDSF